MKTKDGITPIDVFTGLSWEAEMVKNLLENEGITGFLKNEITSMVAPMYVSPGSWGTVTVVVSSLDYEKAKLIVADYEKNRS